MKLYAPAPPRRVDLEHPVDVPGGMLSALLVRPFGLREDHLLREDTDGEGEIRATANAIMASPEVVLDLSEVDWLKVKEALRDVAADYFRLGFKPILHVVRGAGQ